MAFRSRARQFERKLSQTFLSRLRGRERERSSVEVVNSSPSGFMRVVTRCLLGCAGLWPGMVVVRLWYGCGMLIHGRLCCWFRFRLLVLFLVLVVGCRFWLTVGCQGRAGPRGEWRWGEPASEGWKEARSGISKMIPHIFVQLAFVFVSVKDQ